MEELTMGYQRTRPTFGRGSSHGDRRHTRARGNDGRPCLNVLGHRWRTCRSGAGIGIRRCVQPRTLPGSTDRPCARRDCSSLAGVLDAAVERGLPGVAATVLAPGVGTWSGAAGTADGVHPLEPSSQFAIASITKTVVAAQVMRLAEEGRLALGDPVAGPTCPSGFRFDTNGATVANLLAMESGIPTRPCPRRHRKSSPIRCVNGPPRRCSPAYRHTGRHRATNSSTRTPTTCCLGS